MLGFKINWEKSVLQPTQEVEYLGMQINSVSISVWLPKEKTQKLLSLSQEVFQTKKISLRDLASLVGKLQATVPAITLAPMQVRSLQQDLISAQQKNMTYEQEVTLSQEALKDLKW